VNGLTSRATISTYHPTDQSTAANTATDPKHRSGRLCDDPSNQDQTA
jgi:hypothetical protein